MNTPKSDSTNTTLIQNIYNFLLNGEKQIKYSPNQEIVLLLGNTGSGKSTLAQYISGNSHNLLAQEVEEGTGEYVIVDTNNKISGNSTIVSRTIYPDLVEDANTKTIYYDCPGFSDTRSAAHEIAATYFIKKVIDSARSVKMVFVVSHNSVSRGADRQDFILMLQHASDFIKKMEKFKNSIALVVTKVENRYIGNKIVSDEKVITAIGHYLEQARQDIEHNPEMVASSGHGSDHREKVLAFLDIFQSKGNNEGYPRIGIFRKPNEPGEISGIELMKKGKISLETLINKNIQFVKVDNEDFGYTVSPKSKVHISGLAEEINKTILKGLLSIGEKVEEYCGTQEEQISDLGYLNLFFERLRESFSKIQNNAIEDTIAPGIFINEIYNNLNFFKIAISDYNIKKLQNEEDYINFLNLVSNQSIKNHKSSTLAAGLSKLNDYLHESRSFYNILNKLYLRLSQYDIQKKRNKYSAIIVNELNDFIDSPIFKDIEDIFEDHRSIREMKLNKPKLKLLNRVLDQTLKYTVELSNPEIDKIVVRGENIKLSDLIEVLRNEQVKFFEVFALHKVFIDSSLDLTGREVQIAIAAPVWEVLGDQRIILDGKPGMDHQKAKNGYGNGNRGTDGEPGEPGGPAGNFIGIGKQFINENYLHVSANGGRGGRGQEGGDGSDGYDGSQCKSSCGVSTDFLITIIFNKSDKEYHGTKGGDGGEGGVGGYGGHKGIISFINVGKESREVRAKQVALDGESGENGKGGRGGRGGRYFEKVIRNAVGIIHREYFQPIDRWAREGQSGGYGTNLQGRKETWKLTKFLNSINIKTEYKNYILNNTSNNLQKILLTNFLEELENNNYKPTNRKRRNTKGFPGITELEEQSNANDYKLSPRRIKTQNYVKSVDESKDSYHLGIDHHPNSNSNINNPVLSNTFRDTERINHANMFNKSEATICNQTHPCIQKDTFTGVLDDGSFKNNEKNTLNRKPLLKRLLSRDSSSQQNWRRSFFPIEPTSTKPIPNIVAMPRLLANMKNEKHITVNDQYPSMNLHGNLLLTGMVLQKLMGKEISSNRDKKYSAEEEMVSSASELAYRYYQRH